MAQFNRPVKTRRTKGRKLTTEQKKNAHWRNQERSLKKAANRLAHAIRIGLAPGLLEVKDNQAHGYRNCSQCGRPGRRFQQVVHERDKQQPAISYIYRKPDKLCVKCVGERIVTK